MRGQQVCPSAVGDGAVVARGWQPVREHEVARAPRRQRGRIAIMTTGRDGGNDDGRAAALAHAAEGQ